MIVIGFSDLIKNLNKNIFYLLIACVLIPPIINTSVVLAKYNNEDTRVTSGKWIEQNIQKGNAVVSKHDLTGFFGGSLPFFDYEDYQVYKIDPKYDLVIPRANEYYLVIIDNEKIEELQYHEENVVYQINNKWTTGPEIKIYKLTNVNQIGY